MSVVSEDESGEALDLIRPLHWMRGNALVRNLGQETRLRKLALIAALSRAAPLFRTGGKTITTQQFGTTRKLSYRLNGVVGRTTPQGAMTMPHSPSSLLIV